MWDIYQIAPYASGMITAKIGFNEIKKWIKDGVMKDYINKRINDARSNNSISLQSNFSVSSTASFILNGLL